MVSDTAEQYQKDCEARAGTYLAVVKAAAKTADVPCEALHLVRDHPYEAIIDTAKQKGCGIRSSWRRHGRKGMSALVLGSETTKVLTHSKIPVLVCR